MKMPNNYLSVLYKHIIQVQNKNVGKSVCVCGGGGGAKHTIVPNPKSGGGGGTRPLAPLPRFLRQCYIIRIRDLSRLYAVPNIGTFPKAKCTENSQFLGYKFPNWLIYIYI